MSREGEGVGMEERMGWVKDETGNGKRGVKDGRGNFE